MPFTAYIGIGSNQPLGALRPEELVVAAFGELRKAGRVAARSSIYATQPVGVTDQPSFVNAAALVRTSLSPGSLLKVLLEIERRYGRDRKAGIPKGPRTLDLDLLLMESDERGGIVRTSPSLTLPHPELAARRFALAPLAEIAPGLEHPVLKKRVAELLAELRDEGPNAVAAVHILERPPEQ